MKTVISVAAAFAGFALALPQLGHLHDSLPCVAPRIDCSAYLLDDCECGNAQLQLDFQHCGRSDFFENSAWNHACDATTPSLTPSKRGLPGNFGPGLACVVPSMGCAEDNCQCNNYQLIEDFRVCGRMMDAFSDDRWNSTCQSTPMNPHIGLGLPCVAPSMNCAEDDCVCNNYQLIKDFKACGLLMNAFSDSRWDATCGSNTSSKRGLPTNMGHGLACVSPSIGCDADDCACNNYQLVLDFKACGRADGAFTDSRWNATCDF